MEAIVPALRITLSCTLCIGFLLYASAAQAKQQPLIHIVEIYPGNWQPPFQAFFNDHAAIRS